ncbi:MAG: antibiotic biosynthesis monooxygenase [Pseudomonadota bacterium]
MQILLFEVEPKDGHEDLYFRRAQSLKPLLDNHQGLLYLERFKSLSRPNVILSHQHWQDEAAIAKWRADGTHYQSQEAGRYKHFADYRLRVGHVLEHRQSDRQTMQAPLVGLYRENDEDTRRFVVVSYSSEASASGGGETFKSVTSDESYATVFEVAGLHTAQDLLSSLSDENSVTGGLISVITRDYGMYEREEAPQYFAPQEKP